MKKIKQERGITLIALVITIIVLLILAGVAISMLSGENGILTRASEAKTQTENGTFKEIYKLKLMGVYGEEADKLELLKEAVTESNMEKEFDYNTDLIYKGTDEEIKELTLEAVCDDLVQKGFYISCVDGETFITGITDETESYKKLQEIKKGDGTQKYIVETQEGAGIEKLYTGYVLKFNNESKTTIGTFIYYNGDVDLDTTSGTPDGNLIFKYIGNPVYYSDLSNLAIYQFYAMDMNHNGAIDKGDYQIINEIGYGSTKNMKNNVKALKINRIMAKGMTLEEIITYLNIATNTDYETQIDLDTEVYLIQLNKQYTYKKMEQEIKNKLSNINNVNIEFYNLEGNEVEINENNMTHGYIYISELYEGYIKEDGTYKYYLKNGEDSFVYLKY